MKKELKCHIGIGPKVEGVALVAHDNFSARYDLDRIKGVFSRPQHQLFRHTAYPSQASQDAHEKMPAS